MKGPVGTADAAAMWEKHGPVKRNLRLSSIKMPKKKIGIARFSVSRRPVIQPKPLVKKGKTAYAEVSLR